MRGALTTLTSTFKNLLYDELFEFWYVSMFLYSSEARGNRVLIDYFLSQALLG